MQIAVGYRVWRGVRMVFIAVALSLVFSVFLWMLNAFFPTYILYLSPVSFLIFVSIGLVLVGSPDDAMREWHEKQLLQTRELYSTLYNQSPVPYLTVDSLNRVKICNQAAARLFGVTIAEVLGRDLISHLSHEDETHWSVVLGKMSSGASLLDNEMTFTTVDGQVRYVSMSMFSNETFDQRLVSLVDITQHKLVDKAKSEFVALATHQLRTPIAAIRWNVELLDRSLREIANEKQQNYLLKVGRNVTRMIALINDFLSVSKLETGTFSTSPEPIELGTYLPTIVEEFEGQIKEKSIKLTTSFEPSPFIYNVDSRLFHIITSNLLSNAVKYVRQGDSVDFGYKVVGKELVFTVKDSGIGIPKDQLARLFSKFFRASNAVTYRAEGTGLGLYIVKESVTQLGGEIDVVSVENQGTTFTVRFPLV